MNSLPLVHQNPLRHPARRVLLGIGLMAAGTLALLDQHRVFDLQLLQTFWPLALVLLGVARLAWPRHTGGRAGGAALVIVGSLLTLRHLGLADFSMHDWWPAFVIWGGVAMLLRGLAPR
jgi:hypothetical protein